ncbi:hypothetical protein CEP54_013177 [Fusarium duplospermum]|uniref:Uncharacterized protein n=1 Tax=Fusarium duplospermum TaxID=1325734 RepID=A0A428P4E1_9HYPO|nr:hypothetical protein CEP54_013177 [Fusarium duplospermum]
MDSSIFDSMALFEECQVSPSVSAVDAPHFLKEHGVFYQASTEIGKVVAQLDHEGVSWEPSSFRRVLPILVNDSRIQQILDSFDTQCRPACWILGSNYPNHYFASTILEDEDQDHRIAVYICSAGSELEIFVRSQYLPSAGVKAANGMYEVPYPFLIDVKKLQEMKVRMTEGGVMIVHPRFAVGSSGGRAIGYGLPEKGYKFKGTASK